MAKSLNVKKNKNKKGTNFMRKKIMVKIANFYVLKSF